MGFPMTGSPFVVNRNMRMRVSWLVMLPSVILFAFYIWEPLLENVRLSLYSTIRYQTVDFVGLANYARVLKVPDFKAAFVNTFFPIRFGRW